MQRRTAINRQPPAPLLACSPPRPLAAGQPAVPGGQLRGHLVHGPPGPAAAVGGGAGHLHLQRHWVRAHTARCVHGGHRPAVAAACSSNSRPCCRPMLPCCSLSAMVGFTGVVDTLCGQARWLTLLCRALLCLGFGRQLPAGRGCWAAARGSLPCPPPPSSSSLAGLWRPQLPRRGRGAAARAAGQHRLRPPHRRGLAQVRAAGRRTAAAARSTLGWLALCLLPAAVASQQPPPRMPIPNAAPAGLSACLLRWARSLSCRRRLLGTWRSWHPPCLQLASVRRASAA